MVMAELGDRRTYLGASEIAQALNLSPHGSARKLWAYKRGAAPATPHKRIFDRGHDQEDTMIRMLQDDHGLTVVGRQAEFNAGADSRPWLRAHLDGVAPEYVPLPGREPISAKGYGAIELKAPGSKQVDRWREIGMDNDHVIQTQVQLYIANSQSGGAFDWGRFAFLDYDNYQLPAFDQPYDEEFVGSLLPHIDHFWKCVQDGTPPSDEPARVAAIPEVDGNLYIPSEDEDLHEALSMACDHYIAQANAEALYKKVAELAKKAMGDKSKCKIIDLCTASYYWVKGRENIDQASLMAWLAELVDRVLCGKVDEAFKMASAFDRELFVTRGEPYRVFKITPAGGGKVLYQRAKEGEL